MLPPGRYKVICPCALGVPANETDKPFAELRRVQRGLDKPARCFCYASFFWSSVLQAGSLLPHLQRFTFAFWHWCRFLGPPCSPHALCQSASLEGGPEILAQDSCSELAVCALVLHRPPTLHPCKHYPAGCRDVGTMEKQKG